MNNRNELIDYSVIYHHVLEDNKTYSLTEYAEEIKKNYNFFTPKTNEVCKALSVTNGTIVRNRHGQAWLKYSKY